MGRLFWKFFAFFWVAQLTSVLGVGVAIWLRGEMQQRAHEAVDASPPAAFHRAAAAATLRHGGMAALRELLEESGRQSTPDGGPPVLVIDAARHELLGRALSPEILDALDRFDAEPDRRSGIESVSAADGQRYLLLVPPHRRPGTADDGGPGPGPQFTAGPGGPGAPRPPRPPFVPLAAGALVSLAFAALLAWYVARPIRSLRSAFEAAADGRLEPHLAPKMGRRRDELSDLGRDFDRMASRLKALMDSQRRLLHDVSHELRSPLARLQAAIGLARQQPERAEDFLARIERESARMDTLVSELLTLSRLEAGMAGQLDESVDLRELLTDVLDDARFEAAARNCRIELNEEGETMLHDALVEGNGELLHRAIENIVRNAVIHTPPGSLIDIALSALPGEMRIAVRDNGPGLAETELKAIFTPFFRSSAANAANAARGHGLGLAISLRVAEAHRGTIVAANRPSGGLSVTLSLPRNG